MQPYTMLVLEYDRRDTEAYVSPMHIGATPLP